MWCVCLQYHGKKALDLVLKRGFVSGQPQRAVAGEAPEEPSLRGGLFLFESVSLSCVSRHTQEQVSAFEMLSI